MSSNVVFFDQYRCQEEAYQLTWTDGSRPGEHRERFDNGAVRVIDQNLKLGFHVSSGQPRTEDSIRRALDTACKPVALIGPNHRFVRQLDVAHTPQQIRDGGELREWQPPHSGKAGLSSRIRFQSRHVQKQISNSYGASGMWSLLRQSWELELKTEDGWLVKRQLEGEADPRGAWEEIERFAQLPMVNPMLYDGLPVILSPVFAASYFGPLRSLLLQGTCLSEQVHPSIQLVETGLGSYRIPFDDEGVEPQEKVIYRNGGYQSPEFRSLAQCKGDQTSTGNGWRPEYRFLPRQWPLFWEMGAGEVRLQDMIQSLDEGLFLERPIGERIDPVTSLFVCDVLTGYYIRNGRIAGRLPRIRIAMDVVSLWEAPNLVLSQEREYSDLDPTFRMPYLLTTDMIFMS